MMKQIFALLSISFAVACGGIDDSNSVDEPVTVSDDALVKYTGIDGSDQTCEDCCCATDELGNCIVTDIQGEYLAMCGVCTESNGLVTYTPRPRPRPVPATRR